MLGRDYVDDLLFYKVCINRFLASSRRVYVFYCISCFTVPVLSIASFPTQLLSGGKTISCVSLNVRGLVDKINVSLPSNLHTPNTYFPAENYFPSFNLLFHRGRLGVLSAFSFPAHGVSIPVTDSLNVSVHSVVTD